MTAKRVRPTGRAGRELDRTVEPQGPFRIRAVAALTGIPEPTLRAWERRYGIPRPIRTASGYRMYSPHEVDQVRRMRTLCDSGVPAAEAASSVRGADASTPPRVPSELEAHAASLEAIVAAVRRFDDHRLEAELRKTMFLGSTTAILDNILTPALRQIGELWHDGTLSVAQEHLASQRLGTLLRDLLRLTPGAEGKSGVLLACFADDEHELGLLATGVRFSEWGLRPLFLGARTPPGAVRAAVVALSPVLVALSVTIAPSRARASELIADYAHACGQVPWLVGGAATPAVAELVRSHGGMVDPDDPRDLKDAAFSAIERASSRSRKKG